MVGPWAILAAPVAVLVGGPRGCGWWLVNLEAIVAVQEMLSRSLVSSCCRGIGVARVCAGAAAFSKHKETKTRGMCTSERRLSNSRLSRIVVLNFHTAVTGFGLAVGTSWQDVFFLEGLRRRLLWTIMVFRRLVVVDDHSVQKVGRSLWRILPPPPCDDQQVVYRSTLSAPVQHAWTENTLTLEKQQRRLPRFFFFLRKQVRYWGAWQRNRR